MSYGISERDFWNMTPNEVRRAVKAAVNIEKSRAAYDYTLADLIGRSIARIYDSSSQMPTRAEAYPHLFSKAEEEAKLQEQREQLSVIRFKQFALQNNKTHGGETT